MDFLLQNELLVICLKKIKFQGNRHRPTWGFSSFRKRKEYGTSNSI